MLAGTAVRCRDRSAWPAESLGRARRVAAAAQENWRRRRSGSPWKSSGKVTGAVHTDDVLDRIFSRFCVGK